MLHYLWKTFHPTKGKSFGVSFALRTEVYNRRWLYSIFLAIDANFRLKLKARSIDDPELGSGWAYFVEQLEYTEHVKQYFSEKDVGYLSLSVSLLTNLWVDTHLRIDLPCCEPGQL
jgi:hypothetical protein